LVRSFLAATDTIARLRFFSALERSEVFLADDIFVVRDGEALDAEGRVVLDDLLELSSSFLVLASTRGAWFASPSIVSSILRPFTPSAALLFSR
jgi:hypothetical protein